jgi:hypothetical protein
MKKLIVLFAGLFMMTIAVQNVNGQDADASAITTATILEHIDINKTGDLNFGNIVANAGGSVTIAPDGSRSSTGDVVLPSTTPGTITAAKFEVSGADNATYSIVVTSSSFNVTFGVNSMLVDNILTNKGDSPTTGTLDATGDDEITVGATLTVGANQPAGVYTNDDELEITVAYN